MTRLKAIQRINISVLILLALVACNRTSSLTINHQQRDGRTLAFSTCLGGPEEDSTRDLATDVHGNVYVTGGTASPAFPVTANAYDQTFNGRHDVFVAKLDPGAKLVWSTFIGGPNYDRAYAIEVDSLGFVYVAGRAGPGFPTSSNSLQPLFAGDLEPNRNYGLQDGFVIKLSPDGSQLVWSTYFGSDGRDFIRDIAVSSSREVYAAVSDVTRSHPHVTSGVLQTAQRGTADGFVARISADGRKVIYATFFGGSDYDGGTPSIRVDDGGNAYYLTHTRSTDAPITPNAWQTKLGGDLDLILAKISPDGSRLIYSTYIGGSKVDFTETHGLAIDGHGNAYVGFTTKSPDVPTTPQSLQPTYHGAEKNFGSIGGNYSGDGFVAKISWDGTRLIAGTYLGGHNGEGIEGIALDARDNVYVAGATFSDDFPTTVDAFQAMSTGNGDFFVTKLSADFGKVLYSSYAGGKKFDAGRTVAIDTAGNLYVGGLTTSDDWPTSPAQPSRQRATSDAVVMKFLIGSKLT